MITVGGLLLGAVLTAPGAVGSTGPADALANPFDPSIPRVAIARGDEALGLRDPFGADVGPAVAGRRAEVQPDLRDPFGARTRAHSVAAPPVVPPRTDLRSPFGAPTPGRMAARSSRRRAPVARADLRDPFGH